MSLSYIIDCDPGVDDALAIYLAKKISEKNLLAISSANGNVTSQRAYKNIQLLNELFSLDCPIILGRDRPLFYNVEIKNEVHGFDGLAGYSIENRLDENKPLDLFDLARLIESQNEKINIVATGPLTNIGWLIENFPSIKEKINCLYIMGGALEGGNIRPWAEFNFFIDPHAAEIVLKSNIKIKLLTYDLSKNAIISDSELEKIRASKSQCGDFFYNIIKAYKKGDRAFHDPLCFLMFSNPELFTFREMNLSLITGEENRGKLFENEKSTLKNCKVVISFSREQVINKILSYF